MNQTSQDTTTREVKIGDKFSLYGMDWREVEVTSEPYPVDRYPAYTQIYVDVKITDHTLKEITHTRKLLSHLQGNAKRMN